MAGPLPRFLLNSLLILSSALLYAACFPKWSCWWLSFVALIPLFAALESTGSIARKALSGFGWGAIMSLLMGYWLFPTLLNHYGIPFPTTLLFIFLALVFPLGLLYGIFGAACGFFHQDRLSFYALSVPALWILAEYMKELIPVAIPWGGLSIALAAVPAYIQMADLIGAYGVTFAAVAVNSLCWYALRGAILSRYPGRSGLPVPAVDVFSMRRVFALMALLVIVPLVYGKIRISQMESFLEQTGRKSGPEAVLVQANFSLSERWSGMGFFHRLKTYLEMSGRGNEGERVIIWPETALNSSTHVKDDLFIELMRHIGEQSLLISGGIMADGKEGDEGVYNCAFLISGEGRLMRYDKHILLPYAETAPVVDLLGRYYTAPDAFKPGRSPVAFSTFLGSAGLSICFEILYPDFVRQTVNNGAQFLVNISNDAWFDDSPMPYQHLNGAVLRAVENRRYVLRTSNSGISAIIPPTGTAMAKSGLFSTETVTGRFLPLKAKSVYTRFGDLIVILSALYLTAVLVRMIFSDQRS